MMFGRAIFATTGEEHRKLRKMMMPAFSTANLRGMMPHFYDVAERVCLNPAPCSFLTSLPQVRDGLLAPQVAAGPQEVHMTIIGSLASLINV